MSAAIEPEPYSRELLIGYICYLHYKLIKKQKLESYQCPKLSLVRLLESTKKQTMTKPIDGKATMG